MISKTSKEDEKVRVNFSAVISGISQNIDLVEKKDGAIFFSDQNMSDGGFIYFYPKLARELKSYFRKGWFQADDIKEWFRNLRGELCLLNEPTNEFRHDKWIYGWDKIAKVLDEFERFFHSPESKNREGETKEELKEDVSLVERKRDISCTMLNTSLALPIKLRNGQCAVCGGYHLQYETH